MTGQVFPARSLKWLSVSQTCRSSVRAHPEGGDDGLAAVAPVLDRVRDFAAFVADKTNDSGFAAIRAAELTG